MNEHIQVIVATDRFHFLELCRELGLNPHRVKYVNFKDGDKGLAGYYRDNIYPDEYGKYRPYAPESEDLVEQESTNDNYCVFCGEELETNSNGYIICRSCGYDEEYERNKLR